MILPECRWMWEGVEGADSLVVNAHKWLGAPFDCSVYYVRDPEHLMRVMSTNPSFLQSSVDGRGQEPARLGHPARAPLPGAEALVHHPRTGGQRIAEAPAPRHGQCALACGQGRRDAGLAGARSGSLADGVRTARAGRPQRRSARRAYDGLGRGGQSLGRGLSDASCPRRALDGACVDRGADDGGSGRRRGLGCDAGRRRRGRPHKPGFML